MQNYDVIVVGGGPAGATCARFAAQSGLKVALFERSAQPKIRTSAGIFEHTWKSLGKKPADYPYAMKTPLLLDFVTFQDRKPLPNILRYMLPFLKKKCYFPNRDEFDGWLVDLAKKEKVVVFNDATIRPDAIVYHNNLYHVTAKDQTFTTPILVGAAGTGCPVYRNFFDTSSGWPGETMLLTEIEAPEDVFKGNQWASYFGFIKNNVFAWAYAVGDGHIHLGTAVMSKDESKKKDMHFEEFIQYLINEGQLAWDFDYRDHHTSGGAIRMYADEPMSANNASCYVVGDAAGLMQCDAYNGISSAILSGRLCAEAIPHKHKKVSLREKLYPYLYQDFLADLRPFKQRF